MQSKRFLKNVQTAIIVAFVICSLSLIAIASNSKGKPASESEVGGSWSVDMSKLENLWFADQNWDGKSLKEYSSKVKAHFADPDASEFGDHPDFTAEMRANENDPEGTVKILTNAQMNSYLESLPKDNMTIRYIGDYPSGMRMPLLVFSSPKLDDPSGEKLRALNKPIFYLRAQVHGNEVASTAGAIMLAQRLCQKHSDVAGLLDKISIVILPRMNADGTKIHQRGTSIISGDTWETGLPDFFESSGPGGGMSQYGGGLMGGYDQNRDSVWLGAPAARAHARVLAEYAPEFCLDAHEYECNGYYGLPSKITSGDSFVYETDPDNGGRLVLKDDGGTLCYYKEQITTQWGNHLLIPEALRTSSEVIQQKIANGLQKPSNPSGSFFWAPYVDTRGYGLAIGEDGKSTGGLVSLNSIPAGEQRDAVKKWSDANGNVPELGAYQESIEGGFDPSIARNSMGLTGAISFLVESRSAGGRWEFARRTMGQYLTALYYLKAITDDLDNYSAEVKEARAEILAGGKAENIGKEKYMMTIRQDYDTVDYSDVVTQGVYYHDGSSEDIFGLRKNSRFGMKPTFECLRPYAYIIDGSYSMADTIAFRMSNLGVKFERLTAPVSLDVEAYTITNMGKLSSFGASCKIEGVNKAEKVVSFPTGSYVVYMEQPMANYAAVLLEPMSMRSWSGKDVKNNETRLGKEAPFYRYMKTEKIADTESVEVVTLDFTDFFVYDIIPFSVAETENVRAKTMDSVFGETVSVYGLAPKSDIKAYLPSDGDTRNWFVYDATTKSYGQKNITFDEEMNRNYITIPAKDFIDAGDGYYTVNVAVTPAGTQPVSSSSSGCNAGAAHIVILIGVSVVLFVGKKKG